MAKTITINEGNSINQTKHAEVRGAQRGFNIQDIQLIIENGDIYNVAHGQLGYWIGNKLFQDLVEKKILHPRLSKVKNTAVIVDPEGISIVTIMHCSKPPKFWEKL